MTKEQYLDRMSLLRARERELQNQMKELRNKYIEQNSSFKIGDKVLIYEKETWYSNKIREVEAFIRSVFVNSDGDIDFTFFKVKNDGTPSRVKEFVFKISKIELITNGLTK